MFDLREELVRQIIFAMENQKFRYLIDTEKGVLVREDLVEAEERPDEELQPDARYQDIPTWESANGFFLMEQFLSEIHEPIIRDQLQTILLSGSRVFRRFKDTIQESPEIQRRYYRFKYMAMRDVVVEWYNALRELAGLDTLELGADEELSDLMSSDIDIVVLDRVPGTLITELDRQAYFEMHAALDPVLAKHLYDTRRRRLPEPGGSASTIIGAINPTGDLIGFLWTAREMMGDGRSLRTIHQIYVAPEYRGLGIAGELVAKARDYSRSQGEGALLWRAGPASPAVSALVKSGSYNSVDSIYQITL